MAGTQKDMSGSERRKNQAVVIRKGEQQTSLRLAGANDIRRRVNHGGKATEQAMDIKMRAGRMAEATNTK